jgi:hypothetical protein
MEVPLVTWFCWQCIMWQRDEFWKQYRPVSSQSLAKANFTKINDNSHTLVPLADPYAAPQTQYSCSPIQQASTSPCNDVLSSKQSDQISDVRHPNS